jgi:hypothetical protein
MAITDVLDQWGDSNVFLRNTSLVSLDVLADGDQDGVPDSLDNCPTDYNPTQVDSNLNGVGDECDSTPVPPPSPVAFKRITGGGAVASVGSRERSFGFNVDNHGVGLKVHLEYNDAEPGNANPNPNPTSDSTGPLQIKINASVSQFLPVKTLFGEGVLFEAPCVVRTLLPDNARELNTCAVLIEDDGEPGTGSAKKGIPPDKFKLSVISGPSAGYLSGAPALVRGNVQIHY